MTIGLPESKRLSVFERRLIAVGVCALYFCIEVANGAGYTYSFLGSVYLGLMLMAIATLGGVTTLFGAGLAFMAAQHLVISQILKCVFGQVPDSRLDAPVATMAVYCLTAAGFLAAAKASKYVRLRGGRPLIRPTLDPELLARMAVAAAVLAIVKAALSQGGISEEGVSTGGILGLVRNLDIYDTLGIACATASIVISSGGRRFFGWLSVATMVMPLLFGIIGGHRATFLYPVLTAGVTAWMFGFKFRANHLAMFAFAAWFFVFVFSPFAIAIRSIGRTGNFMNDLSLSVNTFFVHTTQGAEEDPEKNKSVSADTMATRYYGFEDYASSTVYERFALVKATDAIVNVTLDEGTTEMTTILPGFLMTIPSFIWPDKPILGTSNMIAHRVPGWVGVNDYSTQISFGLPADSFGAYGWFGAFFIPFLFPLLSMVTYGWVINLNMRNNVYVIALAPKFAVYFAAGTIQTMFVGATQNVLVLLFGLYLVHKVANLADFKYLHPRKRRAAIAKISDPA